MAGKLLDRRPRVHAPGAKHAVVAAGEHGIAAGTEGDRVDVARLGDDAKLGAGLDIPEAQGAVPGASRRCASVGRDGEPHDLGLMACERKQRFTRLDVPDEDRAIVARGQHAATVGQEGDGVDRSGVRIKERYLGLVDEVPEPRGVIEAAGQHPGTVGRDGDITYHAAVAGEFGRSAGGGQQPAQGEQCGEAPRDAAARLLSEHGTAGRSCRENQRQTTPRCAASGRPVLSS